MAKAIKLKIEENLDFCLIGIVSDKPGYILSHNINEALGCTLVKKENIRVYHPKLDDDQEFDYFAGFGNDDELVELIKNKGEQGVFLEEQKQIDFFLKINSSTINTTYVLNTLKNTKAFRILVVIDPKAIKQLVRFNFNVEE
jgi:hypothetical protein